jgi:hypothetical protein
MSNGPHGNNDSVSSDIRLLNDLAKPGNRRGCLIDPVDPRFQAFEAVKPNRYPHHASLKNRLTVTAGSGVAKNAQGGHQCLEPLGHRAMTRGTRSR